MRKALDEMEVPEVYRPPPAPLTVPRPMGAPPFPYTMELANEFCERLEAGEPVLAICASEGMPSWPTICKWKRDKPDFATAYARARESSAESCEHNAIAAAELARNTDDATAQLVKVNAWKWAAAKRNPKIYSDKIDLNHGGTINLRPAPIDTSKLPFEQREAMRAALLLAQDNAKEIDGDA